MDFLQNGVLGISHVDVCVTALAPAIRLYRDVLGFGERQTGDGWVDLDASSVLVRLVVVPAIERPTSLRIQAADVETVFRSLVAGGAQSHYAPARDQLRREDAAAVRDRDGNVINIWRPLTEDEYAAPPELPIETAWSEEGQALLKSLLLAVPALFRGLARRRTVRLAESMCSGKVISPTDVVRAYILASAKPTRGRLKAPLERHGFDPKAFQAEFDMD